MSYIPSSPEQAIFFLHGFGTTGADMEDLTPILRKSFPDTAFYFPTASEPSPFQGYQWFDMPADGVFDEKYYQMIDLQAKENLPILEAEIQKTGLPFDKISIAGFSQGGLMAVMTALYLPLKKAVSFSGMPLLSLSDVKHPAPEILLIEGTYDSVLPKGSIEMTQETLESKGIFPKIHKIAGMDHEINEEAFQSMVQFLKS